MEIRPTLRMQSIGFCIGSTCFILGAFPPYANAVGSTATNWTYFVGSWFFTGAAFIQLVLSRPMLIPANPSHKLVPRTERGLALSATWLAAATQFVGTILFNFSTGDAIVAHSVKAQRFDVWAPNAAGSVAFLISGYFVLVVMTHADELWKVLYKTSISGWVNMVGCIAFGISAWAAYVFRDGHLKNEYLANIGTFIGGICFFLASIFFVTRKYGADGPESGNPPGGDDSPTDRDDADTDADRRAPSGS